MHGNIRENTSWSSSLDTYIHSNSNQIEFAIFEFLYYFIWILEVWENYWNIKKNKKIERKYDFDGFE
jgi:hypothetical protein